MTHTWETKELRRRRLLNWVFKKAGLEPGMQRPWWATALVLLLLPSRLPVLLAGLAYNPIAGTIAAGKSRWSLYTLESLANEPHPSHWIRVVGKTPGGLVLLEQRINNPLEKDLRLAYLVISALMKKIGPAVTLTDAELLDIVDGKLTIECDETPAEIRVNLAMNSDMKRQPTKGTNQ